MISGIMAIIRSLAYLSLPVLALRYLASKSQATRYYIKVTVYVSSLGAICACGAIASVFLAAIGQRYDTDYWTGRAFYWLGQQLLDIHFDVEGAEHLTSTPSVFVGNHQSMLDILYLGCIFPRRTVVSAKKELKYVPLLGQLLVGGGALLLDRSNPKRAIESMTEAGETLKKRSVSLWVFPEGTRSMNEVSTIRPFKKGAFHLAIQTGFPIVPVVCENYWKLYHPGFFGSGRLKIKVLPPIPTSGLTTEQVSDLAVRLHKIMLETLQEISTPTVSKEAPNTTVSDSLLMPPPPLPSIGITEVRPGGRQPQLQEDETLRPRTTSLVRSIAESEDNETEEEDGHVLVRRP